MKVGDIVALEWAHSRRPCYVRKVTDEIIAVSVRAPSDERWEPAWEHDRVTGWNINEPETSPARTRIVPATEEEIRELACIWIRDEAMKRLRRLASDGNLEALKRVWKVLEST